MQIRKLNTLGLMIFVEHRSNWQNGDVRWSRHNKFLYFLKDTLIDLGISFHYPEQHVQLSWKDADEDQPDKDKQKSSTGS